MNTGRHSTALSKLPCSQCFTHILPILLLPIIQNLWWIMLPGNGCVIWSQFNTVQWEYPTLAYVVQNYIGTYDGIYVFLHDIEFIQKTMPAAFSRLNAHSTMQRTRLCTRLKCLFSALNLDPPCGVMSHVHKR